MKSGKEPPWLARARDINLFSFGNRNFRFPARLCFHGDICNLPRDATELDYRCSDLDVRVCSEIFRNGFGAFIPPDSATFTQIQKPKALRRAGFEASERAVACPTTSQSLAPATSRLPQ